MTARAFITGVSGLSLTGEESAFLREASPWGLILFKRNVEDREQVSRLVKDFRDTVSRVDAPVLIDQEGGRVQRLKPPHWRDHPPMRHFGELAARDKDQALSDLRFTISRLAEDLRDGGISVNCAPVLDVAMPGMHDVIGDRAFSSDPEIVALLGMAACQAFLAAGITPVFKHLPGHGRAQADSHKELPVVAASHAEMAQTDFAPFKAVARSDIAHAVWGMPTPVKYTALDPDHAACASPKIIRDIIRGEMGFDGFLVSDALDMEGFAAYGNQAQRVLTVLRAGCDAALYCAGKLEEMEKIAESVPKLSADALRRLQKAADFQRVAAKA